MELITTPPESVSRLPLTGDASACATGRNFEVEIALLKQRTMTIETNLEKMNCTLGKIETTLDDFRSSADRKPSWAVTIVLAMMSSGFVGMLMFILGGLG